MTIVDGIYGLHAFNLQELHSNKKLKDTVETLSCVIFSFSALTSREY